ncbi:MAG: sialate O-acetylesterase [Chthoniobacteraceae bacterium]|nr:sialate O-acetylesterase [Chthoniobacteraceae bacterium]
MKYLLHRVFRRRFPLPPALFLALMGLPAFSPLRADVRLPAIFGDHMVLQRNIGVPVWGWADPGETVTVKAGTDRAAATAGPDGKWSLTLARLAAFAQPIEVTIAGKNSITLRDVLVGDVWLCSGQSNMEAGAIAFLSKEDLAQACHPQIRLFTVPLWVAPSPADDIAPASEKHPLMGKWQVCTPETVAADGPWLGFPAVAFFFGRDIHQFTHQPVGLIVSSKGATRIASWTSLKTLASIPERAGEIQWVMKYRDDYNRLKQTYETVTLPQWKAALEKWNQENKAAIEAYPAELTKWERLAKEAAAQNQPAPVKPVAPDAPKPPANPLNNSQRACALFNGMIAPLAPYGIKGVVWYQGEANVGEPVIYRTELPALIRDWRTYWGQGDFPFLLVQLANYMARKPEPGESNWAAIRETQLKALDLPNTGLAVAIDIGDAANIHPFDKADVSSRLALAARHAAYGDQDVVYSGPIYKRFAAEGDKIRITFDNTGGGLTIGRPPDYFFVSRNQTVPDAASELRGFAIAGADHQFVRAKASIEGNSIVVAADAVRAPVAVRYAWADNPDCNLYNKEGLPASPFRTDDFPLGKAALFNKSEPVLAPFHASHPSSAK